MTTSLLIYWPEKLTLDYDHGACASIEPEFIE